MTSRGGVRHPSPNPGLELPSHLPHSPIPGRVLCPDTPPPRGTTPPDPRPGRPGTLNEFPGKGTDVNVNGDFTSRSGCVSGPRNPEDGGGGWTEDGAEGPRISTLPVPVRRSENDRSTTTFGRNVSTNESESCPVYVTGKTLPPSAPKVRKSWRGPGSRRVFRIWYLNPDFDRNIRGVE